MNITVENIIYQLDIYNTIAEVVGYENDISDIIIPSFIEYEGENYSVTSIGRYAFYNCESLTSVNIPDSVTEILIGDTAFGDCKKLCLPQRYTEDNKLIAYKAFNLVEGKMKCKDFIYEEGMTYHIDGDIKCCERGFHACTSLTDVFNYYCGELNKEIVIHEVYLSGDIDEDNDDDSKVCASKIEIGRRLTVKDINNIINSK